MLGFREFNIINKSASVRILEEHDQANCGVNLTVKTAKGGPTHVLVVQVHGNLF